VFKTTLALHPTSLQILTPFQISENYNDSSVKKEDNSKFLKYSANENMHSGFIYIKRSTVYLSIKKLARLYSAVLDT